MLEELCIILLLNGMLQRHLAGPAGLCFLSVYFLYFCCVVLCSVENEMLMFPVIVEVFFLSSVLSALLYMFCISAVRCVNVYTCCIHLID